MRFGRGYPPETLEYVANVTRDILSEGSPAELSAGEAADGMVEYHKYKLSMWYVLTDMSEPAKSIFQRIKSS